MRLPRPPRRLLVVLVVLAAGVAGAATVELLSVTQNDDGTILNQPGGPTTNLTGDFDAYPQSGGVDDTTIQWNTSKGNATFSSPNDASARIAVSDITGQWTNVTNVDATGTNLTINPEDKARARVGGDVTATSFQQADGIAVGDEQTDIVYSATNPGTITLFNLPASTTFDAVSKDGDVIDEVTTDASGVGTMSVVTGSDVQVLFVESDAPVIEDASPKEGAETNQSSVTLSATISDQDFADPTGDDVTAEFYLDDERVDTQTVSSNGTISTEVQPALGEQHTWRVELVDKYGNTASIDNRQFRVPAKLRVYYETDPETLVSGENLTLRIRFFPQDGGEIETREVNDGVANLTGLPVEQSFVVTVRANETENFVYRRIVVDNLYETQRVFMLRENVSHSRVVFELSDPTGQFPPEETTFYVEKPITINNSTQYYVIAGDTFGATGRFPAVLRDDERYRLRAVSEGSERILGAYNVYGSTVETIQIQRIEPVADDEDQGSVYGSLTQEGNTSTLAVRYRGGEPGTSVEYYVTDGNGTVVVPNTTVNGSDFAHLYQFNETGKQEYNVTYEIIGPEGQTTTGYFLAGQIGGVAERFDIDPQVLSLMSWAMILASMGLVVIIDPKLAPASGTGVATALTILGTVAIPLPLLGVAGAIAVLTLFGGSP